MWIKLLLTSYSCLCSSTLNCRSSSSKTWIKKTCFLPMYGNFLFCEIEIGSNSYSSFCFSSVSLEKNSNRMQNVQTFNQLCISTVLVINANECQTSLRFCLRPEPHTSVTGNNPPDDVKHVLWRMLRPLHQLQIVLMHLWMPASTDTKHSSLWGHSRLT